MRARHERTRRLDLDDLDGERVAFLGALDVDRAGLGVEVGPLEHPGRQVILALHARPEGVVGEHVDQLPGRTVAIGSAYGPKTYEYRSVRILPDVDGAHPPGPDSCACRRRATWERATAITSAPP